jgi:glutamine amidotransferase
VRQRIAIVDYGAGNLASVMKAFRAVDAEPALVCAPTDLDAASAIVIPGVGHFGATAAIDGQWRAAMRAAIGRGVPLLGICLGMHFLFDGSDEAPGAAGLGLFNGRVARMTGAVKVPHVGWNALEPTVLSPLFHGVNGNPTVYFTHSYAAPPGPDAIARTTHGATFASIVARGNVTGMQFHPEKSGAAGLALLRNWISCSANA